MSKNSMPKRDRPKYDPLKYNSPPHEVIPS